MKFCAVIPCHNHGDTIGGVLASLPPELDAVAIDDGSAEPVRLPASFGARAASFADSAAALSAGFPSEDFGGGRRVFVLRLEKNCGKAEALKVGFAFAKKLGATHAITIDADGQHSAEHLPRLMAAAEAAPQALVLAARDFSNPSVPRARRFMNKFSNFWFWAETGSRLGDTQCGFRVYPLALIDSLDLRFGGFVFEVELLVKAAWLGAKFAQVKIPAVYTKAALRKSHYRPIADTLKFTLMNTRLFFASVFFSKPRLRRIASKK